MTGRHKPFVTGRGCSAAASPQSREEPASPLALPQPRRMAAPAAGPALSDAAGKNIAAPLARLDELLQLHFG